MMRVLLDTHILLWAVGEPTRLPEATKSLLRKPDVEVLFSAASIWEIAIKAGLRRADFGARAEEIAIAAAATGFGELPVRAAASARVADLPMLHRDPFDRLLIAQAITEPAFLITADALLAGYSELVDVIRPA